MFTLIYRNRIKRSFGKLSTERQIVDITFNISEWTAFKLVLPRWIWRIFFKPAMSELHSLHTIRRMAEENFQKAEDKL